jgi:hypothetical protein
MSLPLTPALVAFFGKKRGLDVSPIEVRHASGEWSVLIRIAIESVRYFIVTSQLAHRIVWVRELSDAPMFTCCLATEDDLDSTLATLEPYVRDTEPA